MPGCRDARWRRVLRGVRRVDTFWDSAFSTMTIDARPVSSSTGFSRKSAMRSSPWRSRRRQRTTHGDEYLARHLQLPGRDESRTLGGLLELGAHDSRGALDSCALGGPARQLVEESTALQTMMTGSRRPADVMRSSSRARRHRSGPSRRGSSCLGSPAAARLTPAAYRRVHRGD